MDGAERERENPKQDLYCQLRAQHGAQSHKLRSWPELNSSQMLNQLSQPDALIQVIHFDGTVVSCDPFCGSDFCGINFCGNASFHLSFFSFFLGLAKGFSILCAFSKNQLLVSLIFSIIFLVFISFTSALIFVISFLLLTWDSVCSFSSSLSAELGCLFENFLFS